MPGKVRGAQDARGRLPTLLGLPQWQSWPRVKPNRSGEGVWWRLGGESRRIRTRRASRRPNGSPGQAGAVGPRVVDLRLGLDPARLRPRPGPIPEAREPPRRPRRPRRVLRPGRLPPPLGAGPSRNTSRSRLRDRVGALPRSSALGERSARGLQTGSWRRGLWSFWSSWPARMPWTRARTISRKVCSVRSGARGSSRASAKARVSPTRWSNWRMGSSPASLESWPDDGSMTSGVPKKSRTWGQTGGILTSALRGKEKGGAAHQVRRERRGTMPIPTRIFPGI
jgi:hypothetical protein